MDWMIHRIATSDRYHVSPHEIRSAWLWREVLECHAMLDAFAAAGV
ncbi:MAG: hypothetical protein AAGA81_14125 [Acidobacteriota bacterium]